METKMKDEPKIVWKKVGEVILSIALGWTVLYLLTGLTP